jgi:hypothetical protein
MSKEEKSVRGQVTAIEERTAKLDSVLKKLSDSLDRISESLAKQQPQDNDQPDREELIKQFKQPFATPQAVTKEGSSDDLLNDIKDSLVLSQKDNFKLFKSIEETLLRIEQMGGSLGGGGGDTKLNFGGGRGKPDAPDKKAGKPDAPDKKLPTTGKAEQAAEKKAASSTLSKVGSGIAKVARVLPGVGLAVGAGMAAYEGVQGFTNAEDTLGIEGREATLGEKVSAAGGSIVEGLSFGLVSGKSAGNFFAGMFGAGPDAKEKEKEAQKAVEAGVPPEQAAQVAEQVVSDDFGAMAASMTSVTPIAKNAGVNKAQPQSVSDDFDSMAASMTSVTPISEDTSVVKKTQPPSTAGAIATANIRGAAPDFKYIEEQRRKREGVKPATTVTGETPSPKVEAAAKPTFQDLVMEEAKKFGRDNPTLDDIKAATLKFKAQQLEGKSEGMVKGVLPTQASPVSPPPASVEPSKTVSQVSQENADMRTEAPSVQPVVINNQSSVSSNQQSFTPLRTTPRPNNNSFERKQMAVADY